MCFDEVVDQMKLRELKELVKLMPDGYKLSTRALNILWCVFSNDQAATCLVVDLNSVERFVAWIESGHPDDAWS